MDSIVEVILPNDKTEFEGRKKSHKSRISILGRAETFQSQILLDDIPELEDDEFDFIPTEDFTEESKHDKSEPIYI